MSLTEVTIAEPHPREGSDLYIYADIVDTSIVGSKMEPLLRKINLGQDIDDYSSRDVYNVKFVDNQHYRTVSKGSLASIGINITTMTGQLIQFSSGGFVSLSLHFKKKLPL